ncbi:MULTISPECIES: hypothetical protein [Leptospira]|nr:MULTISPECIES: hypothetical protein [Leptospira]
MESKSGMFGWESMGEAEKQKKKKVVRKKVWSRFNERGEKLD